MDTYSNSGFTRATPVDEEIMFQNHEVIVSKTDLKGRITYANDVFCRVAEMKVEHVLNQPHNIIRHPDMPRSIFKLVWDTLQSGDEIFAYIKNMSATGKYYWVIAHVTPTLNLVGEITGFHSNRRKPDIEIVQQVSQLYSKLIDIEASFANRKQGLETSHKKLMEHISEHAETYDQFVWNLRK